MTAAAADEYAGGGQIGERAGGLIHVVNKEGEFCTSPEKITKFMGSHGLLNCGTNYTVVAIMGAQSSGKSTLLNMLFGTDFEELNSQSGRQMTTKGVWFGASPKVPHALVMDLEGTDSVTRGVERHPFERQSALLALSVAEVLIINMWQHDIGRYVASNYGVLSTIFEVNLALLAEQLLSSGSKPNKTLLLFSIRDHSESDSPLSVIARQLSDDIIRIWADIKLPDGLSHLTLDSLFDVEFTALPHKKFESSKFVAEVDILRKRFTDVTSPNYLFSSESRLQKTVSVPASGLGHFVGTIWETIINHKDLNLPSHKEMLAIYRCDEQSTVVIDQFQEFHEQLKTKSTQALLPDFATRCNCLIDDAVESFDESLRGYHAGTVQRKREDLRLRLLDELKPLWTQQMLLAKEAALKQFKSEIDAALPKQTASHRFAEVTREVTQSSVKRLHLLKVELTPFACNWSVDLFENQLLADVDRLCSSLRESQLSRLLSEVRSKARTQLLSQAGRIFDDASPEMWHQLRSAFDEWLNDVTDNIVDRKLFGIEVEQQRHNSFILEVENDVVGLLKEEAAQHAGFVRQKMQKCFDREFRLNSDGLPRIWHEEHNIRASYLSAKTQNDCQLALNAAESSANLAKGNSRVPVWVYPLIVILGANEAMIVLSHPMLALTLFVIAVLATVIFVIYNFPHLAFEGAQKALRYALAMKKSFAVTDSRSLPQMPSRSARPPSPRKSPRRKSPMARRESTDISNQ